LSVIGRRSGRESTRPVWFVRADEKLYLVPIDGTDSDWFRNLLAKPTVRLTVGGHELRTSATLITDGERVAEIVAAFRAKYGQANFERHYPKPDAAVELSLGS
jgi:deazaflavin-dependent oxidoreductase (nitroreductase family)